MLNGINAKKMICGHYLAKLLKATIKESWK